MIVIDQEYESDERGVVREMFYRIDFSDKGELKECYGEQRIGSCPQTKSRLLIKMWLMCDVNRIDNDGHRWA